MFILPLLFTVLGIDGAGVVLAVTTAVVAAGATSLRPAGSAAAARDYWPLLPPVR